MKHLIWIASIIFVLCLISPLQSILANEPAGKPGTPPAKTQPADTEPVETEPVNTRPPKPTQPPEETAVKTPDNTPVKTPDPTDPERERTPLPTQLPKTGGADISRLTFLLNLATLALIAACIFMAARILRMIHPHKRSEVRQKSQQEARNQKS